jgi:hypothetical protein
VCSTPEVPVGIRRDGGLHPVEREVGLAIGAAWMLSHSVEDPVLKFLVCLLRSSRLVLAQGVEGTYGAPPPGVSREAGAIDYSTQSTLAIGVTPRIHLKRVIGDRAGFSDES